MPGKRKGEQQRGTKAPPSEFARAVARELNVVAAKRGRKGSWVMHKTGMARDTFYKHWGGQRTMDLDQFRSMCDALRVEPSSVLTVALGLTSQSVLLPDSGAEADELEEYLRGVGARPQVITRTISAVTQSADGVDHDGDAKVSEPDNRRRARGGGTA